MTRKHADDTEAESGPRASSDPTKTVTPESAAPKLRGLWSVMSAPSVSLPDEAGAPLPEAADSESDPATPADEITSSDDAPAPRMRGLWSVMAPIENVPPQQPLPSPVDEAPARPSDVTGTENSEAEFPEILIEPAIPLEQRSTRAGLWALGLGVLAIPLSALSLLPGFWPALPAAGAAFTALWLATNAAFGGRLSRQEQLWNSIAAVAAIAALALGSLYFAPHGNALRGYGVASLSETHLRDLGRAVLDHEQREGSYPLGSAILRDADDRPHGGLGWMARLLPYLGEETLAQSLNFDRPFDDPTNEPALKVPVEAFFAAGGSRTPLAKGYAPAHFAGVGGRIITRDGKKQPLGIFQIDNAVRAADITDGLSQTWIAGEVARNYAPWGDPENWRSPGKGLNRDSGGFGSASGRGTALLFADGTVRIFANQTDPELLRRLATRSAADLATDWKP